MACPMGFTEEDLERLMKNQAEEGIVDQRFPDAKPFASVAEPYVTRKMAKEAIYLTGGQYAILMQWLHPGIARSSAEHADFNYGLVKQLQTMSRFFNACIFGTEMEKRAMCNTIHQKNAAAIGEGYSADDPELHKWTAATLYMSLKVVHEAFFTKLTRREEERLYKESAIYGTSLRMPTDLWPETLDDFYAYWNHNVETLPVTTFAHTLFEQLMYPKHIPIWMKPYMPIARLYTAQWLPPRLQKEYGLHNNKIERGMYKVITTYVRLTYPLVPKKLREHGHNISMKKVRENLKQAEETGNWEKLEQLEVEKV